MSARLHVSANQWRTSILKACIGTNVTRGVAEDIADACLALLATGNDPLPCLLKCLQEFESSDQAASGPSQDKHTDLGHLQVLRHGPSAIDLVHADRPTRLSANAPELVLGLAQARHHSHGLRTQVAIDDGEWVELGEALAAPAQLTASTKISLRSAGIDTPDPISMTNLPQPSREDWQNLQRCADRILVPADATSREDAGVGDGQTDND